MSSAKYEGISEKMPLSPHLIPSRISIPPTPPPKEKSESIADGCSPISIGLLGSKSSRIQMKVASRKPPLYPRQTRCVSPTDLRLRADSPSMQMKSAYMRRFLSEISEENL
mmetsp:Transcript_24640/g.42421  ORF Transcript_24640/g.42421 Transcript_24640/m.42421 type:complete len:111 (-) Transcript_24640:288-620(-)